jgi:DNA-binding CsgD family transcriptional regulator
VWRDDGRTERIGAGGSTPRERLDAAVRSRLHDGDGVRQVAALPALVAGRWSIVHVGDTDGRRYVVALDNPPDAQPLAGLSPRQAQVLGLTLDGHGPTFIAYELGLAQSTISHHLGRLREHFGVTHDVALIEVVGALLSGQRAILAEGAHVAWLPAPDDHDLTPAERTLVAGLRAGHTDEQLAVRRGVSVKTVRNQLHRLFQKVGVHSRLELVTALRRARSPGPGAS